MVPSYCTQHDEVRVVFCTKCVCSGELGIINGMSKWTKLEFIRFAHTENSMHIKKTSHKIIYDNKRIISINILTKMYCYRAFARKY